MPPGFKITGKLGWKGKVIQVLVSTFQVTRTYLGQVTTAYL